MASDRPGTAGLRVSRSDLRLDPVATATWVGACTLAVGLAVLVVERPAVLGAGVVVLGGAVALTRPLGRLTGFVAGGLLVLGGSSEVGTAKLGYLAFVAVAAVIAATRAVGLVKTTWGRPAVGLLGTSAVYILTILCSSVLAVAHGNTLAAWVRDASGYLLLGVVPVLALDAAATITRRAASAAVAVLGTAAAVGFGIDWLTRRGVSALPVDRVVLASLPLCAICFVHAVVRAFTSRHRVGWGLLAVAIPACLLVTGTRTAAVLVVGLAGVVGSPRRGRVGGGRLVLGSAALGAVLVACLPLLVGVLTTQADFLSTRLGSATAFLSGDTDASAVLRQQAYATVLDTFAGSPLLGVAPGHLFPSVHPGEPAVLNLDTPALALAKFGVLGSAVLLAYAVAFVVAVHRSRVATGWSAEGTAARAAGFVLVAFLPFGAVYEDKGLAFGLVLLLVVVFAGGRERTTPPLRSVAAVAPAGAVAPVAPVLVPAPETPAPTEVPVAVPGSPRPARRLAVLQLDHRGHRLAYVRALVENGGGTGETVVLLPDEAIASDEARVHLEGLLRSGRARVVSIGPADQPASELLRRGLDGVDEEFTLAVPEADHLLAPLARSASRPGLPRLCLLLMRTPDPFGTVGPAGAVGPALWRRWTAVRGVASTVRTAGVVTAKAALVATIEHRWPAEVRACFLTDSWGVVTRRRGFARLHPVPDPCPVLPHVGRDDARAALGLDPALVVLGLLGDVSARKHPDLVLDALDSLDDDVVVLVAGRVDEATDRRLAAISADPRRAHRVVVRRGYLDDGELARCVAACDAVVLAYDTDAPSGMLALADRAGVPVVAAGSAWVRAVVVARDAGVVTSLSPGGIVDGVRRLRAGAHGRPSGPPATGPLEFARALLGVDHRRTEPNRD